MSSKIEQQVMASVGTIYAARTLTSLTALKIYALVLSLWGIGRLVWVSKVFENFFAVEKRGFGAVSNYVFFALSHTQFLVQLTLAVAMLAFVALCVDFTRSLAAQRSLAL